MDRVLVLLRHGQSEWNLQNLFTGWRDPALTPLGIAEAKAAGAALRGTGIVFERAFVSELKLAQDTLTHCFATMGQTPPEPVADLALNERSYGDLSGLNKDEARAKWGEDQVRIWRRSFDVAPPGGESLRDTVARTVPFYVKAILPGVLRGEATIVAAHGNSLRALAMVLDGLTPEKIPTLEIFTGVPLIYRLGADAIVTSKEVLKTELAPQR